MAKEISLKDRQDGLTTGQKLKKLINGVWHPSDPLFGIHIGVDIHDFEASDYTYFLDNVRSLEGLREGLRQLSPLADDALEVAEFMDDVDFYDFKLALAHERCVQSEGGESTILEKHLPLLLPQRFLAGTPIAEKFNACLGVTCIRIMEVEIKNKSRV